MPLCYTESYSRKFDTRHSEAHSQAAYNSQVKDECAKVNSCATSDIVRHTVSTDIHGEDVRYTLYECLLCKGMDRGGGRFTFHILAE